MKNNPPSLQEWKELYQAAVEFKEVGCWDWMWDSDVFGVQNPTSGEIGYCCVMGGGGEHFALAVYLGTEGLRGYLKLQLGDTPTTVSEMLHSQKCLMASFEDREFLHKKDHQIIKNLGLKFRGRKAWPLFRNYSPGYHPWFITSDEAKFLTLALYQTIDVALRFKDNPEMLTPPEENQYLVRVPEKTKEGLSWRDEWLEPLPLEKPEIEVPEINETRLAKINERFKERLGIWEVGFFHSPQGVQEKNERPYYPYVVLWVEYSSGYILNLRLTGPPTGTLSELSVIPEQLMEIIENIEFLPQEILVDKEETFKLLEPITRKLGIKLSYVERLMVFEETKTDLVELFLSKRKL